MNKSKAETILLSTKHEDRSLNTAKDSNKHREQAIKYNKLAIIFRKNNTLGIIEALASLVPLYYISKIDSPYSKPLGCLFMFVAVFLMARDYTRSKNLDTKVAQLVLKGINLEKKNPSFDRFFHNVLGKFSVVKILVSRSLSTVVCVYYLSACISKILLGENSAVNNHKVLLGLIGVVIAVITCILYYSSYEEFDKLKSKK